MLAQFDPKQRIDQVYKDTLQIYKARLVKMARPGNDRLTVRIMPHMASLPTGDPLPEYPFFFKGQVLVGVTEEADKSAADYVWVVATPDFTVGYILGLANIYERPGSTNTTKYSNSYNFTDIMKLLKEMQLGVSPLFKYENVQVQYWNENVIEMVNVKTGDKYIVHSSGNVIAMEQNQIYLRTGLGKGGSEPANYFSAIQMTRGKIIINTPELILDAKEILLGRAKAGLCVATIASPIPIQVEGATIKGLPNVKA